MKNKMIFLLKRFLFILLYSLILLGIGVVIALTISARFHYQLREVLSYEGLAIFILGILASLKGNPSGTNFNGIGQSNENAISYFNLEVTRRERETKPYYKDFLKNNVVHFALSNITLLLCGALMIAISLYLYH